MSNENRVGKIEVDSFNFIWKIKDFENQCEKVGDYICSPFFQIKQPTSMSLYRWYLKLYPHGDKDDTKGYLSLYMYNVLQQKDCKVQVNLRTSLLSHISNEEVNVKNYNVLYTAGEMAAWGCCYFISREELFSNRGTLLVDDTLKIKCTIHFDPYSEKELTLDSTFCNDFQQLYSSEKFSDVTIQIGRKKIKAHKSVLAARSETFSDIIDKVKQENGYDIIKITDFSYEVMSEVMSFIYCNKVDKIQQFAMPLLKAAERYKLDSLKIMCGRSLWKSLTINNATETLKIADSCECPGLKSKTMKFIIDNIKNIVESDGFKLLKIENPKLLEEILCEVAKKS